MYGHDNEEELQKGPSWRVIALGACALVISLGGLAFGLWSSSLDQRLTDIATSQQKQWEVLNDRSSLLPRTTELEKRTDDQEHRLREIEIRMGRK